MDKPTEHIFAMPRRTFVTTLVAGFTLAAGPVSADAIITDANGLDAGQVDVLQTNVQPNIPHHQGP